MRKNNTSLSLTVILFIVTRVFNLQVYASELVLSDERSKTNIPKADVPKHPISRHLREDEDSNETEAETEKSELIEGTVVETEGDITNNNASLGGKMAAVSYMEYNGDLPDEDNNDDDKIKMVEEFDHDYTISEDQIGDKSDIRRSLKAGDIFTPYELLPVTKRLLKKVELPPGVGRGIVSSSKNPEDLADRIFAAYFLTMKRIVILKAEAIVGLDALQALAIEGDPEDYKYIVRTMSKYPPIMIRRPDKEIESHLPPKRSRYKLLTKKETKVRKAAELKLAKQKRRQLLKQLEKKMPKNRHVIVNPKDKKQKRQSRGQSLRRALLEPGCTWHYECRDPRDLESCHLKAKCDNNTLSNGHMDEIVTHAPEEEERVPDSFRRAVGLSVIDEEVEKIISKHVLHIRPENFRQQDYHLESVEQYFNMLMARHSGSTTPLTPNEKTSKLSSYSNTKKKKSAKKLQSDIIPLGIPFRKNNGHTRRMNPTPSKSVDQSKIGNFGTTEDKSREATPRVVQLIG